jgi:hypothetical protein
MTSMIDDLLNLYIFDLLCPKYPFSCSIQFLADVMTRQTNYQAKGFGGEKG